MQYAYLHIHTFTFMPNFTEDEDKGILITCRHNSLLQDGSTHYFVLLAYCIHWYKHVTHYMYIDNLTNIITLATN